MGVRPHEYALYDAPLWAQVRKDLRNAEMRVSALEDMIREIKTTAQPDTRPKRPLKKIRKICDRALAPPEGETP